MKLGDSMEDVNDILKQMNRDLVSDLGDTLEPRITG